MQILFVFGVAEVNGSITIESHFLVLNVSIFLPTFHVHPERSSLFRVYLLPYNFVNRILKSFSWKQLIITTLAAVVLHKQFLTFLHTSLLKIVVVILLNILIAFLTLLRICPGEVEKVQSRLSSVIIHNQLRP